MNRAFLFGGALIAAAIVGNPAYAHRARKAHDVHPRDFMALDSSAAEQAIIRNNPLLTNDPLTTATGGPSGGLPDRN